MKKLTWSWLIVFLLGLTTLGISYQGASANNLANDRVGADPAAPQRASPTLIPTSPPVDEAGYPTPTPRVLPPIGTNAGLVIGASVLVLIIIGGVLSSRLRQKR